MASSSSSRAQSPSYPRAARFVDSQCYRQYTASLKCLEEFNKDRVNAKNTLMFTKNASFNDQSKIFRCQSIFDCLDCMDGHMAYQQTKLLHRREARLEHNRNRSLFS